MTVTRRRRTGRKARQNRRAVIIAIIACASCLVLVASLCIWLMMSGGQTTTTLTEEQIQEQAQQQEALFEASLEAEEEKNSEYINSKTIDQIVGAGKEVSKALSLRPQTVEMTDENRDEFVNILSCNIADSGKVEITAASEGIPKSDDKYYYLFEEATYEESIDETKEPVAKIYKDDEAVFSLDLNKGAADSRLFSKFQVAVKLDDKFVPISHAKYITNPGACAGYSYGGMQHKSIKGLLPDPLRISELQDLGCEYAT